MCLPIYLAMTAQEFQGCHPLPRNPGWMSCHFSSSSTGLSNLPESLPEGSLLILDDSIPMADHDISRITQELESFLKRSRIDGLLLDFQRTPEEKTLSLVKNLSPLPCPVAATRDYAKDADCAVFLAPCPAYVLLKEHLKPYKGREIWLEAALSSHTLVLTENGCDITDECVRTSFPHKNTRLHCHYDMVLSEGSAEFSLCRTKEDLAELLEEAQELGLSKAVGLFQELGK